jgi:hypothetical protein
MTCTFTHGKSSKFVHQTAHQCLSLSQGLAVPTPSLAKLRDAETLIFQKKNDIISLD